MTKRWTRRSTTFALGLSQAGVGGGADKLIPITFVVIVATALLYGLSGAPVAHALGVAQTGPGGVLLLGATPVGRAIGRALHDRGLTVVVWTRRDEYAHAAEADGLTVYRGDPIEDAASDTPSELDGVEYALVAGDDPALDAMIATDLAEYFGRDRVFQLPVEPAPGADFYTRAQLLFHDSATHDALAARIEAGAKIAAVPAPTTGKRDVGANVGADGIPMFVHTPGKQLRILTAGDRPALEAGQELIGLIERS